MSKELAKALDATNSENDLHRFEELMSRDVEPEESFEEFRRRYAPIDSDSPASPPLTEDPESERFQSPHPFFNINIFIDEDDESEFVL